MRTLFTDLSGDQERRLAGRWPDGAGRDAGARRAGDRSRGPSQPNRHARTHKPAPTCTAAGSATRPRAMLLTCSPPRQTTRQLYESIERTPLLVGGKTPAKRCTSRRSVRCSPITGAARRKPDHRGPTCQGRPSRSGDRLRLSTITAVSSAALLGPSASRHDRMSRAPSRLSLATVQSSSMARVRREAPSLWQLISGADSPLRGEPGDPGPVPEGTEPGQAQPCAPVLGTLAGCSAVAAAWGEPRDAASHVRRGRGVPGGSAVPLGGGGHGLR
jgi:hypothetical protein